MDKVKCKEKLLYMSCSNCEPPRSFIHNKASVEKQCRGTSLAVQWLRLRAPNAGGTGSIPGWGTKIPHVAQSGQKKGNSSLLTHAVIYK